MTRSPTFCIETRARGHLMKKPIGIRRIHFGRKRLCKGAGVKLLKLVARKFKRCNKLLMSTANLRRRRVARARIKAQAKRRNRFIYLGKKTHHAHARVRISFRFYHLISKKLCSDRTIFLSTNVSSRRRVRMRLITAARFRMCIFCFCTRHNHRGQGLCERLIIMLRRRYPKRKAKHAQSSICAEHRLNIGELSNNSHRSLYF